MATKIIELEISKPSVSYVQGPKDIATSRIEGLEGYQKLQVLARMGEIPLGLVWLDIHSPSLEVEILLREVHQQLGEKISFESSKRQTLSREEERDDKTLVSICVCTRNRPEDLRRCLDSLMVQDYPSYQVVIIDNDPPTSATKDLVASYPQVTYVLEPKRGLNFARNRAIQEAKGEIVSYIDDDAVADPRWVSSLAKNFQLDPRIMCCTGPNLALEMETEAQELMELRGGIGHWFEKKVYQLDSPVSKCYPCKSWIFGTGCNMSFRKKIFDLVGSFDEALDAGATLPGGGDLDMFYRIIRAGYKIAQDPQVLVWHRHRRLYKELRSQMYNSWGRGVIAFLVKILLTDKPYRKTALSAIIAWYGYQLISRLPGRLWGREPFPANLIFAELLGGIVGLGSYFISRRRIAKIKMMGDYRDSSTNN
jgi:glycosyltransferase involved in cell wall biosynthesis